MTHRADHPAPMGTLPLFSRPEEEKADATLRDFERRDTAWLDALRDELRKLYAARVNRLGEAMAYVTADDARRMMDRDPRLRPPAGTSNNALGALFRTQGWEKLGYTKSTTEGSHGNLIAQWAWQEAA